MKVNIDIFDSINIDAGQWYRTGREVINQIAPSASGGMYRDNYGIKVVANTPQELIQEGDMISTSHLNHYIPVTRIHKEVELFKSYEHTFDFDEITEIWTRTSDNTFTRQYKKEVE